MCRTTAFLTFLFCFCLFGDSGFKHKTHGSLLRFFCITEVLNFYRVMIMTYLGMNEMYVSRSQACNLWIIVKFDES